MKAPAQRVFDLYVPDSPRTFREDLEAHMFTGYVFSTPEMFLMGRAVRSTADPQDISNPWKYFPRDEQDCWLVHAYADLGGNSRWGLVKKLLRWMPYELPLIAWGRSRDNVIRVFPLRKFQQP